MSGTSPQPPGVVAYLVNQYPKTSHSFVRREIRALESIGHRIVRLAIRGSGEPLVEAEDREEAARTRVLLEAGLGRMVLATAVVLACRPLRFLAAMALTWRIAWRSDRGLLRPWAWLLEACLLLSWARRDGVRHVHAHFGTNATAVAMLAHVLGGPTYSFTAHGTETFDSPPSIALRQKVARAAFVVAVCAWGRAQILRWCAQGDWAKVHVVRCGVDARFRLAAPTAVPAERRVVCVARLSPEKGVETLIDAMALLRARGCQGRLVVLGGGEAHDRIAARIAASGLDADVTLAGWADADVVRREIAAARALVVPSLAEGLPVVIMEAMSLHRPVVATAVGGIAELVRDGTTGWLVSPGSPEVLADAIQAVFEAPPEQLQAMGGRGARHIAACHDVDREAVTLSRLFAEVR